MNSVALRDKTLFQRNKFGFSYKGPSNTLNDYLSPPRVGAETIHIYFEVVYKSCGLLDRVIDTAEVFARGYIWQLRIEVTVNAIHCPAVVVQEESKFPDVAAHHNTILNQLLHLKCDLDECYKISK